MKKWFNNFIKKIAEENSKNFSSTGKLDCCGLNSSNNNKKVVVNNSNNKK